MEQISDIRDMKWAIDRSIAYNEIVHVSSDLSLDDMVDMCVSSWQVDYSRVDTNVWDVWGWTESTPEDEQDWRILVHLD